MRVFPNWIKTTLKEDKEFYRAVVEAAEAGPDDDQRQVLALVKQHHLDGNRDLTRELYNSFLNVLEELLVERPSRKLNTQNLEAGSWYAIPGMGKLVQGQNKSQRLASRKRARQKRWQEVVDGSDYSPGELDALLAADGSKLDGLTRAFLEELVNVETNLQKQIDELRDSIERLESSRDAPKSTSVGIE